MIIRCDHCKFYDPFGSDGNGECRRHAPRKVRDPEDSELSCWPIVTGDVDWCGEFMPDHPEWRSALPA